MLKVLAVLVAAWLCAGLYVDYQLEQHRSTSDSRFCTLSSTIVTYVDQGLSSVSPAEAKRYPSEYERGYTLDTSLIKALVAQAPCAIHVTLPPNLLTKG